MSKINLKIVGIIICILIAAVLFKDVILVNNSPKKVVMEYVTAIANKDYDKLYELSHIEDFCSDKTFLDKETFINYCKEQYDDYTFAQDKLKEYMTGVKSDEKLDNEVGDFKIEDIVYGDKRQDATVTVYSLKYDKSESIYVQKIDDKWIIDDLANLIIKDYKLKVPKYLKLKKIAGVEVDDKYITSQNENEVIYTFPELLNMSTEAEYEIFGGIKYKSYVGTYYEDSDIKEEYIYDLKEQLEEEQLQIVQERGMKDIEILLNGIYSNKSFESISNNFSDTDDLGLLEDLYNQEKEWFYSRENDKYFIDYESSYNGIFSMELIKNENNRVSLRLHVGYKSDGTYIKKKNCSYDLVYNLTNGKLVDLQQLEDSLVVRKTRKLFPI